MKKNILITTVGAPGFDCIFSSIKEWSKEAKIDLCIIGIDADENALGKHFIDVWYKVPRADQDYLGLKNQLNDIIKKHKVDLVIPIGDVELDVLEELNLSKNLSSFPAGKFKIKNIQDKLSLYDILNSTSDSSINSAIPRFKQPKNYDEIQQFVFSELKTNGAACAKPKLTSGARGVLKIIENEDLDLEKIKNSKFSLIEANVSRFLNSCKNYLESNSIFDYVLSEYLPGDEYSVDLYISPIENFQIAVSRKRKKITSGICTEAVIEDPADLKELSIKIAKHLCLMGNVNMQFKQDVDGKFKLLEINPRLSGAVVGCKAAEIDFVKLMLTDRLIDVRFNKEELQSRISEAESNKNVMKRTYKEYFIVKEAIKI